MSYQKILSQEQLDALISEHSPLECFVSLNYGLRSSKTISLNENNDYLLYNECDDHEEIINHNSLMSTSIGNAISRGALYKY